MSSTISNKSKSVVKPALIMIPDISGFTEYMNDADLSHSQMRISSLLEVILESNVLGLKISEIEGDSILFYSFNHLSSASEIIEQCQLMFTKFHEKLKEFESLNCQCGSCQKLQDLGLKFILHFGMLGSIMVKDYCKLFGRDLIIAHRLLKNSLSLREYILITNDFTEQFNLYDKIKKCDWKNKKQYIKDIGLVEILYMDLKPMLNQLVKIKFL